jgi:hypothetical protein
MQGNCTTRAVVPVDVALARGQCLITISHGMLEWSSFEDGLDVWLHNLYIRAASDRDVGNVGAAINWAPFILSSGASASRLWMTNVTCQGGITGLRTAGAVLAAGVRVQFTPRRAPQ